MPPAEAEIATKFDLSDEEREQMLPSGKKRVLHNRIHWAKFYLTKAGLLESPKHGRFAITPAGQQVLTNPPASLDTKYLLAIPAFRDFYRGGDDSEAVTAAAEVKPPSATPEEVVEAAYKAGHATLRADLLDRILQNSPGFFERVIVELLVAMSYGGSHRNASEQLGKSGDGGVDASQYNEYLHVHVVHQVCDGQIREQDDFVPPRLVRRCRRSGRFPQLGRR